MKLGRFERAGVIDPEKFSVIIMGQAPLGPVTGLAFSPPGPVGKLIAFHVVGDIDLIIHIP